MPVRQMCRRASALLIFAAGASACAGSEAGSGASSDDEGPAAREVDDGERGGEAGESAAAAQAKQSASDEEAEIPAPRDGVYAPRYLLAEGEPLLDTEVRVEGVVSWIYDCAEAVAERGMSEAEVEQLLEDEPERCERPNLRLGRGEDAPREHTVWVVDVPRAPTPDEREALPPEVIEDWPEVPEVEVGDRVIITGTWTTRSRIGATAEEGLLEYGDLEHVD